MTLTLLDVQNLRHLCFEDPSAAKPVLLEYERRFPSKDLWVASRGALFIDIGGALDDAHLITKGIAFEKAVLRRTGQDHLAGRLYNIANGYSGLFAIERACPTFEFDPDSNPQLEAMRYLREAITIANPATAEMLVNYGNCLSSLGRWDEALSCWRKALACDPGHAMAMGNLGVGLLHFAGIANDARIIREAADALTSALESPRLHEHAGSDAKRAFEKELNVARSWLDRHPTVPSMPPLKTIKDAYVRFCFENRLILTISGRELQDRVALRMITDVSDEETYFRLSRVVNEIKERFGSARFLAYQAGHQRSFARADRLAFYTDISDCAVYGCRVGHLKIAFEAAFNVLDKIALFLNDYMGLKVPESKVTFAGIFKGSDGKLRSDLLSTKNYSLYALYGISRDFAKDGHMAVAKRIRNFSTHRYLVPHEESSGWRESLDGGDYHIGYGELYVETLKLLQIVKTGIVYLIALVDLSERNKRKSDARYLDMVVPHYHPTDIRPMKPRAVAIK